MTTKIVATDTASEAALEELMVKTLEGIVHSARAGELALVAPQALSFALAVILDLRRAQPPSERIAPGIEACCRMLQDRILPLTHAADPKAFGGA